MVVLNYLMVIEIIWCRYEEFHKTLFYFQETYKEKPINFLEIGTASNLTNTMFWNNLNIDNNVIVDVYYVQMWKIIVETYLLKDGTVFIIGDSVGEKVKRQVSSLGLEYDIVFCDGNHDYEYVKKDYEFYSQMVKVGGYFVFHDIDNDKMLGVRRFIEECDFDGFKNIVNYKVMVMRILA